MDDEVKNITDTISTLRDILNIKKNNPQYAEMVLNHIVEVYKEISDKTIPQSAEEFDGNSFVVYCPVVDLSTDLLHQEAFILERKVFIECLKRSGCFREGKRTSNNTYTEAIQTIWNNKQNKPHGKKLFALLDELYEHGTVLGEWLEELGA